MKVIFGVYASLRALTCQHLPKIELLLRPVYVGFGVFTKDPQNLYHGSKR